MKEERKTMKRNLKQTAFLAFIAFALSLGLSGFAAAQEETSATITGQVTDSAGAAIANATVVVTNLSMGTTRTDQSNSEGNFTVFPLTPGDYTVSVEQTGFKKYVQNITLSARDRRPLQIALEVGAATETVTVTSEPPLIQESPTGQALVSGNQVTELPLNNRNFIRLLETIPGVSSDLDDESSFGLTSRASVSINGLRRNAVNYLVDGVSNTDVGSNITLLSTPTVDSIQEFKVLSSNYTAEIGRSGGGAVIIVTKGGGNEFHGNLYEFVRNDRFNANSFFNNRLGRNPLTGNPRAPVPKLRYNNFGGTFSGPVYFLGFGEGVPPVYNGKNKTFFFFSEEQRRITRGTTDASATVPSLLERQGNFSASLQNTFYCRLTAAPFTVSTSTTPGTCAAGAQPVLVGSTAGGTVQAQVGQIYNPSGLAYAGNIIPANNIDPRSLALLQAYPQPNNGTRGFTFTPININNTRQEVIRIDHNFNQNHKIFGRYTQDTSNTQESGGLFTGFGLPNLATTDTSVPGRVFAVSYTGIFSSSLVNELTYNYSTNTISSVLVGRGRRSDYPGAENIAQFYPENNNNAIPTVAITGFSSIGSLQGFSIEYGNSTFRDVLTYTRGNHILKFGAELSFEFKNENAGNNSQGTFGFTAAQTQGRTLLPNGTNATLATTGNAFASYLLGLGNTYSEAQTDIRVRQRFGRREFFVQDTWRVRPNLTLDLGVRYQYFLPVTDVNNTLGSFDPGLYTRPPTSVCVNAANCTSFNTTSNTTTGATALDPLLGIGRTGVNSRFGRAIIPADKNNFSPRVGLAYDPFKDGKTIIRAGYGFYFDQPLVGIFETAAFGTPPYSTTATFSSVQFDPAQTVTFSNPSAGTPPTSIPLRALGTAIAPDFETPESQVWSVGVQREVFKNAVVDVSYVRTKGDKLIRRRNINFLTPQQILNNGVAGANALRPYLGYGNITYYETSAKSRYNGLLSSFQYRFARGFTFTAAYTLSKNMTDSTNDRDAIDDPQNPFDTSTEYAEARTSRRHVFSASYVYELPFFRNSGNALARLLLGGYQVSGITQIESGAPVPRVAIADTGSGIRGLYPNLIGDPSGGLAGTIDPATGLPFIFDPTAFEAPANGTFGNAGRAFARLPGRNQTNIALSKQFYFNTERTMYIQLRAESFNVFNQTQFIVAPGNSTTLPTAGPLTNTSFARPTGTRLPREFQFGAKFYF